MTTSGRPLPQAVTPFADTAAEAARYALLRRLAPSMRHHLVVNLQPIGMVYEVMERRLRAAQPDLREVHDSARKINSFARAALDASLDAVTWLASPPDVTIAPDDAVRECLGMVATSLTFRGFALRNEVGAMEGRVQRCAVRNTLTAALIHLTDENASPAHITLTGETMDDRVVLTLSLARGDGAAGFAPDLPYRALTWHDVQAIAAGESVEFSRDGRERISRSLRWLAD